MSHTRKARQFSFGGYSAHFALGLAIIGLTSAIILVHASTVVEYSGFRPDPRDEALQSISEAQLVLFYSPTCEACTEVRHLLARQLAKQPGLQLAEVDNSLVTVRQAFNRRFQLPGNR